ncbi:Rv3235 family protein [Streptomyces sp.]|uniref:Rv3235 family protein n=1 Tax=Streptomyces sp. TaxID=1931 RepID=UPI002F3F5849
MSSTLSTPGEAPGVPARHSAAEPVRPQPARPAGAVRPAPAAPARSARAEPVPPRRHPAPTRTAPAARRPGGGTAPPGRRDSRRPGTPPPAVVRPLAPHVWFAGRLLDVLTGRQPLTSLAGRVRDEAYQELWALRESRADWRQKVRGRTPDVYSCRFFRTAGGALEVAAVVRLDRTVFRALAFRLEPGDGESGAGYGAARWRCTAVAAR